MLAALALGLAFAPPGGDVDVERFHDRSDRIACIRLKRDSRAFAVRCGAKGRRTGLLLAASGRARRVRFVWRTDKPDIAHSEVAYGRTLTLAGSRCTFLRKPSVRVRCRNRGGHEIVVTRTRLRRR
jgi:hypothetical protein